MRTFLHQAMASVQGLGSRDWLGGLLFGVQGLGFRAVFYEYIGVCAPV